MRKLSTIALVSCLTLGATAAMAAQTTPSTSMDKPATSGTMTKTTKTTATTKTTTTKSHKVTGEISNLDCAATPATVTIVAPASPTDLVIIQTSTISVDGKKAKCADLKNGEKATASYATKDGKNNVRHLSAKSKA
jgi:hypothetical protein